MFVTGNKGTLSLAERPPQKNSPLDCFFDSPLQSALRNIGALPRTLPETLSLDSGRERAAPCTPLLRVLIFTKMTISCPTGNIIYSKGKFFVVHYNSMKKFSTPIAIFLLLCYNTPV